MSGWRGMTEGDLSDVVAISDAVHGVFTEPREVFAERLMLYPEGCRIFEADGAVGGFLVTHPWHAGAVPKIGALLGELPNAAQVYYLHDIALLPVTRGKGAGGAAMAFVLEQAVAAGCETIRLVAVNGADSYWAAQGFAFADAEGEGPYGPGSYLMARSV